MNVQHTVFVGLAAGRGAIGVVSLVAPRWMAERWFGPPVPPALVAGTRLIGVRDVVLAAGMLAGRSTRQRALFGRAAALADAGDTVLSLVMATRRAPRRPVLGAAVAGASSVAGGMVLPRRRVA